MPVPLQTRKEGRVAKHETAEECSLILKKVLKKALQLKEQHGVWAERDLYISHDKASYFTACKKPDGEGEVYQLVTMPTHSPDLHQLVEHSIAPIKRHFKKIYSELAGKVGHGRAMSLLEKCIKESVNATSLQKNTLTFNQTLHSVLKNGGDWANSGLR